MRLSAFTKTCAATVLAMGISTAALAQGGGAGSDHSGPGGAGAGISGNIGSGLPRDGGFIGNALTTHLGPFRGADAAGVRVVNPVTGETAVVPQLVAHGMFFVFGGESSGPGATTFANGLMAGGALSATCSNSLIQSLAAFGSSRDFASLVDAIAGYNAAVNCLTGPVPPALLAVRQVLAGIMGN